MSKIQKFSVYYEDDDIYVISGDTKEECCQCINDNELSLKNAQNNIEQYRDKAQQLINDAQIQAREMIFQAEQECTKIRELAISEGRELGYEEGKSEGLKEYNSLIDELHKIVEEMKNEKYALLNDMEKDIVGLSVLMAEKIIYKKLADDEAAFLSVVSKALCNASNAEQAMVYVSPEQYDSLNELKHILKKGVRGLKSFDIIKTELEHEFDCLIVTECEEIDAGIASQINKLKQSMKLSESFA